MNHYITFFGCLPESIEKSPNIGASQMPSKKAGFIFLVIQLTIANLCFAQTYSQLGTSDTLRIYSKVFQANRKAIITKSLKIKDNDTQNQCILYMDADDQNINGIFLQTANNLMAYTEIPKSYLVGIIQEDRNKELVEKNQLLKFINEELMPVLNQKYHIAPQVTIAGHSFGAYFATYAFLQNNAIYQSCIAISPAYWPNENDVLNLLHEKANALRGNFYLAIGDKRWDEISLRADASKAQQLLSQQKNILFKFDELKGFSHNASPTTGFALGLSFVYDEWEWTKILLEQENRLKSFPDFWGHLEIKADALFHLDRVSEAKVFYREALKNVKTDPDLAKAEIHEIKKRLGTKIKKCS